MREVTVHAGVMREKTMRVKTTRVDRDDSHRDNAHRDGACRDDARRDWNGMDTPPRMQQGHMAIKTQEHEGHMAIKTQEHEDFKDRPSAVRAAMVEWGTVPGDLLPR